MRTVGDAQDRAEPMNNGVVSVIFLRCERHRFRTPW